MLKRLIIERIRTHGPMTFESFMEMVLYHPEYGYYMKKETQIGREGDFYTAPHLHRAFGAALMKQIEECWEVMGRPEDFTLLEMGAGMGYLARDMLDYATTREVFHCLQYYIVEMNKSLMARQAETLSGFLKKIKWFSSLKEVYPLRGCLISNELLDSFPVHVIEFTPSGVKEIYITTDGDELYEIKGPLSDGIVPYLREFSINLPEGFRTEVNLRIRDWLNDISQSLTEGFIITIDYGYPAWQYYSEDYPEGTLQYYYRHRKTDNPYIHIGEQDMTSHVNFSALKKWGEELGFKNIGYTAQGRFIVSIGIEEIINELVRPEDYGFEIARIKSLILPEGMGESHKIMIQYKGELFPALRGFKLRNELRKL